MLMITLLNGAVSAQTQDNPKKDKKEKTISSSVSAKDMNKRLEKDLNTRYPSTTNGVIIWDDNEYGYNAIYSLNRNEYLTHYDREGNYQGTMIRKEWKDETVPPDIRNLYDNSKYRTYQVEGYWQTEDPDIKGYYMELKTPQGQKQRIWVDENGEFLEKPKYKKDN